jgi:RNA polymerase sigma-70 factor (ECF subfamily)
LPDPAAAAADAAAADDATLLARAGRGERAAFDALVDRHGDAMYRLALRTCGPGRDAEDAVQDALLAAWRAAAGFRGQSAVRTWLLQIVVNACHRRHRLRAGEPARHAPVEDAAAEPDGESSPEARTQAREVGRAIDRALAEMTPEAREVLVLRDVEGLTGEETAAALGVELAAMKSRLHRARLELKQKVEAVLGHPVEEVVP